MKLYYSATTGEFYDSCVHKNLPDDAVKIGDPNTILATQKYVDDALQKSEDKIEQTVKENFAPLNNPVLTGIPTGPTPDVENDSEQLATTAFVQMLGERYITHEQGEERFRFPEREAGYQILPSGLILQWGFANVPTMGGEIWFPLSFPNEVRIVQITHVNKHEWCCPAYYFRSKSKFFVDSVTRLGVRGNWEANWFALGY